MRISPKFYTLLLLLTGISAIQAQSYDKLENRFSREKLTAEDSAAFKEQGLQKVRSLFYKVDLYQKNQGNLSNQSYISQSVDEQFYVEEGDTLDLAPMFRAIDQIQSKVEVPELRLIEAKGCLAGVETVKVRPKLTYQLILKQAPKKFGKRSEVLWQVFLSVPTIEK